MAKKSSSSNSLMDLVHKHHLIPSSVGGVTAYFFSGVVMLGLIVFAAVWVGNMVAQSLKKK